MRTGRLGFPASLALLLLLAVPSCAQTAPSEVTFDAEDGLRVVGDYYRPKFEKGKSYSAVILLHMLRGSKSDWADYAAALRKKGIVALAIDLRGHGKSVFKKGVQIAWRDFSEQDYKDMVKDVKAAVEWLGTVSYVDTTRIAVVGASIGANVALRHAVGDEDIAGVGLLSAGRDYRGVTTYDAADKYGDRPMFLAASEDDGNCAKDARHISGKVKGSVLKIYSSAGHGTRMFGNEDRPGDLKKSLTTWLEKTLAEK